VCQYFLFWPEKKEREERAIEIHRKNKHMMLDLRNGPKEKLSDANAPQSLEVNGLAIVWKFLFQTKLITEQISIKSCIFSTNLTSLFITYV
jgi:hypothetical protein